MRELIILFITCVMWINAYIANDRLEKLKICEAQIVELKK